MRSKLFLAGVTFAIGCGGGGGGKAKIVDAMVDSPTIDAAPTCAIACDNTDFCEGANLNTGNFPALGIGRRPVANPPAPNPPNFPGDPVGDGKKVVIQNNAWVVQDDATDTPVDWYFTYGADAGGLAGRKSFSIGGIVSPEGAPEDLLIVRVTKPETGGFLVNTAVNFDPDPTSDAPAAFTFFFGDVVFDNQTGDLVSLEMEYWGATGSIKFTSIGENDNNIIDGTTAPLTWREIDEMGADVAGGCTASMGMGQSIGFSFYLQQTNLPDAFQPVQNGNGTRTRTLNAKQMKAVNKYIDEKYGYLWNKN